MTTAGPDTRRSAARVSRDRMGEISRCARNDNGGSASRRSGFTLVELLVALAIFITVMAIVALLFTAAIRTSKQGVQNQEAFELARGAMRLFERDLSKAFTNRDHGDVYSFYGTPIGFTFVGMVAVDGRDAYNLARVTYVIYHDSIKSINGAIGEYETIGGSVVPTYNLIRFVEPGVDNLDAYRLDWNVAQDTDVGSASLEQMAQGIANQAGCATGDLTCQDTALRTARRELWIRMLAGGGEIVNADVDNDGFLETPVRIPSAWDTVRTFTDSVPPLRPEDYVVAENLRYLSVDGVHCAATESGLENFLVANGTPLDFDDYLFMNTNGQFCAHIVNDANATPIFDEIDPLRLPVVVPSPDSGPRPFFTYWDIGIDRRPPVSRIDPVSGQPVLVDVPEDDLVVPMAFTFWNDVRNLLTDGIDNDLDGFVDELDEQYGFNVGSPLDARLPLAVTVDFTLFFPSPYPGAPDFNQRFTQRIDLPTGYRRIHKTNAPPS